MTSPLSRAPPGELYALTFGDDRLNYLRRWASDDGATFTPGGRRIGG